MSDAKDGRVVDELVLRFKGTDERGNDLHELRASHVAEVLQGIVELSSDFDKAGAFNEEGLANSEVLVRPAQEGSFLIEVVRFVSENWEGVAAVVGAPTLAQVLWWTTRSIRADVQNYERQDNGMVKVIWQDNTVDEIPAAAWEELQKRKRRRKKQLRQILAPLADERVTELDVATTTDLSAGDDPDGPAVHVLTRPDYVAAKPEDEVQEKSTVFEVEAQMSAIDFDDPAKWRVRTKDTTRKAVVEDAAFLARVADGLALRKTDIFRLRVREDEVTKNGRRKTSWTVLQVEGYRRASGDGDD